MDKKTIYVLETAYNADNVYVKNEIMSNRERIVYAHKDNESEQLIFEQLDKGVIEVRTTYDSGELSLRDKYKLKGNKLLMISSETFKDVRTLKGLDLPLMMRIEKKQEEIRIREEVKKRKRKEQNK